ncbi:hypothetical protein C8F04DRAFT_326043 [Mycena alexandri]|uniref:F-box domain-containing protein n=1 Tax=Mycena alexandri TaxID=1745969 RepID=A0AAD6S2F8_9AGAR|nr:hypothetical protein C8F04DRAFT_326043 [Mycena alexandri]
MKEQNPNSLPRFVLAIPELLDHIVDYLADSPEDLLACALVSKSWVPRAQFHLFRKVELLPPSKWNDTQVHVRLLEILRASRQLRSLVRYLSFSLSIRLLDCLDSIPLPNLEEISVECTDDQYIWCMDIKTSLRVRDIFMSIPTLSRVNFSGQFQSISIFHHYFENCAANIQSLELVDVYLVDEGHEIPPDPPPSFIPSRMQLSRLSLPNDSPWIDAWILGPHCPFGFSQLKSLQLQDLQWEPFQRILTPSFPSLEDLKLNDFSGDVDLDFGMLTALKRLDVDTYEGHIPKLLTALSSLPLHNSLQTLSLRFYCATAEHQDIYNTFDTDITNLVIVHSLRRVEIHLSARQLMNTRPVVDMPTFQSYFPSLTSKGWLFIYRKSFPVCAPLLIHRFSAPPVYNQITNDSDEEEYTRCGPSISIQPE